MTGSGRSATIEFEREELDGRRSQFDPLLSVTTVCYREIQIETLSAMGSARSIEGEDFPSDAKSRVAARSRRGGSARLRAPVSTVTLRQAQGERSI
jgi:hypothetical protein